ncbi:hypothetical protein CBS147339_2365 [Penicillium roqueforti]|uniref:Uncharacterized protein n=1 Tax=Penicillium roqueforti (strain FM164) TaxID=1365484 RepID=W6QKJ4_PENRF|nr:hypothetical protein CBS147339_2365 [Penicillium roqueforti]CDM36945.1 unnamed protein product [Penicillium roqueforti FM164]
MDNPETAEFLCGLDGTAITLDPPSEPPLHLPRQTWVIDKTLSERSEWMTQQDVDDGLGLPEQGEDSIVPESYITYLVWDKVPRESLREEEFWGLEIESRREIRDKFREAFPKLKKHGYLPRMSTMSKIIYEKATGNMHFSGFSRAGRTDANEEWHDKYYVLFRLAKPSPKTDWVKDLTGWTW